MIETQLSPDARERWGQLDTNTQKEIMEIMNETILTMPVSGVHCPAPCRSNEPSTSATSRGGSTKKFTRRSSRNSVNAVALVLICLSCFWPRGLNASQVDARLLKAVCQVESNGRTTARGDVNPRTGEARALGAFQFWRPTWDHVSLIRRKAGLQTISYKDGASNLLWSREYARTYLQWCESYLQRHGVHTPTRGQIYMVYNCGPGSARKKGFKLANAPATTQRAAAKVEALCR